MCEETNVDVEKVTNFEKVPEGGNDEVEAIRTIDEKTTFALEPTDYAVIARGDMTIEQIIPKRLEHDGCVENDIQAFFLFCCLIFTSQNEDPEAKAIVENIYAHCEVEDELEGEGNEELP